jgi:hypothetical protein
METGKLSPEERAKIIELSKVCRREFGTMPKEIQEAVTNVEIASHSESAKGYGSNFFNEYIKPNRNSLDMCLAINEYLEKGDGFDRAVAKVLCGY